MTEEVNKVFAGIAFGAYMIASSLFWPLLVFGLIYFVHKKFSNPKSTGSFFSKWTGKTKEVAKEVVHDVRNLHYAKPEVEAQVPLTKEQEERLKQWEEFQRQTNPNNHVAQ